MVQAMISLGQATPSWIVAILALAGCIATLIKAWSLLRKVELDAAGSRHKVDTDADGLLILRLMERQTVLEGKVEEERRSCDERIAKIEKKHEVTVAELTALKLDMLAKWAAERVLHAAAVAERDVTIAALRTAMHPSPGLVKATERVAEETGRVADATEQAAKVETKTQEK